MEIVLKCLDRNVNIPEVLSFLYVRSSVNNPASYPRQNTFWNIVNINLMIELRRIIVNKIYNNYMIHYIF